MDGWGKGPDYRARITAGLEPRVELGVRPLKELRHVPIAHQGTEDNRFLILTEPETEWPIDQATREESTAREESGHA